MLSTEEFLKTALRQLDDDLRLIRHTSIGGGCINSATKCETSRTNFFLKWNSSSPDGMFRKESMGLNLLIDAKCIGVPKPLCAGEVNGIDFLILEYLEPAPRQSDYWDRFGQQLAELHRTSFDQHGLDHSNYIGRLHQSNDFRISWIDFFIEQRLEPQLELARTNRLIDIQTDINLGGLMANMSNLMPDVLPSLLHGDLWSGNFMTGPDGNAWLIDPAVYFGSREIEIAFTTLFGGFERRFYEAYNEHFPLEPGFDARIDLYNLYPLLVHLNLFGTSYLGQIKRIIERFI